MASPEELQTAIEEELNGIQAVLDSFHAVGIDTLRNAQLILQANNQAVRDWRLNVGRTIKEIDIQTKTIPELMERINPQINALNSLLRTELTLTDKSSVDEFNRLKSLILSNRKLLRAIYNSQEKVLPQSMKEELDAVLEEIRTLQKIVARWLGEVKRKEEQDKISKAQQKQAYEQSQSQVSILNDDASLEVWFLQSRSNYYQLKFTTRPFEQYANSVFEKIGGWLEDNLDATDDEIKDFVLKSFNSMYADVIYQAIMDDDLTILETKLIAFYRNTKFYQENFNKKFEWNAEKIKIIPLNIVFESRVELLKLKDEEISLSEDVLAELKNFMHGQYSNTIDNHARINEISRNFGTLPINIQENQLNLESEIRKLKRRIQKLKSLVNSNVFGKQRNSEIGAVLIDDFKASIDALLANTTKTKDFTDFLDDFESISQRFENWINNSWVQFGGTPSGVAHSMGGLWAKKMGL